MRAKRPGRNDSGGERDSGRNDPVPLIDASHLFILTKGPTI
jgi:hypothetical protein